MAKIIGNPTVTPMAVPDWNQTDSTKADFIKNKPTVLTEKEVLELIEEHGGGTGQAGLSAYEIALKNGFVGTEEEWLLSLEGKDGDTPIKGTDYWTNEDKAEIKSYVDEAILGGAW